MIKDNSGLTRRYFLETTAATAAASTLPLGGALGAGTAKAPYVRHNATSPEGQRALQSYAKAVDIMLRLPASDPHNWFRNAFVHFMDCPHGNWWFYVWHRGFIGYFEQTIRLLSGDASFAIPYWDWTQLPRIPDTMFNGVLTPDNDGYSHYTGNLDKFTKFIKPTLQAYWNGLSPAQRTQLNARGYTQFDQVWFDVQGAVPNADPKKIYAVAGNMAFASTCNARYLTRDNPALDAATAYDVSATVVGGGLMADKFYIDNATQSFNSSKTASHNTQPSGATMFSTLEGLPHNKTHNYIGGYGPLNYGPYGNMTNNLSPIDPIFFLHHSNMDRLWDVWTRRQQVLGRDWRPDAADAATYYNEPFLFFVGPDRKTISGKAQDYFNMSAFNYTYQPGFGEELIPQNKTTAVAANIAAVKGTVQGGGGLASIASAALSGDHVVVAAVTVARPTGNDGGREFDVLINAPENATNIGPGSPYYAGTIAFFGHMSGMDMPMDATFAVPLPKTPQAANMLRAGAPGAARATAGNTTISIRVVPSNGGKTPELKALSLGVR
ncbi:MAG TPA: tyrosinase family protein [Rhizomicrobium sp.]|jgi:tyrosinase